MKPSSRTPEGSPNRCPVCSKGLVLEPSEPFGDAPCPHCGHLLWFIRCDDDLVLFDGRGVKDSEREQLAQMANALGIDTEDALVTLEYIDSSS